MRDNRAAGRLELDEAGHTAFANYRRAEGTLIIDHVEAPPALRGTGAAARLMAAITQMAAAESVTIIPLCAYAAAWLRRHPDAASPGLAAAP